MGRKADGVTLNAGCAEAMQNRPLRKNSPKPDQRLLSTPANLRLRSGTFLVETRLDQIEFPLYGFRDGSNRGHDGNRDTHRDQRVLDRGSAVLIGQEAGEELGHVNPSKNPTVVQRGFFRREISPPTLERRDAI
jgi:hypothetical protein